MILLFVYFMLIGVSRALLNPSNEDEAWVDI